MRTASALEPRLALAAFVALCAMLALGVFVSSRPPLPLDLDAAKLRGHGISLAVFFTMLGRWPALALLGATAVVIAAALRSGVTAVVTILIVQVLSQSATTLLKVAFHRARPDAWLRIREIDFSYPSGHAVTAVVFFVGLALLAWHAPLPRPIAMLVVAALAACAIGIPWSRIVLGAHYLSDVVGGLLFGAAWLCVASIVLLRLAALR